MKKIFFWIKSYGYWILFIVGFIFGLFRLKYFLNGFIPLGYDPGIYKEIFKNYLNLIQNFDFSVLATWINEEPLLGLVVALLNKVGVSFDWWITRGVGFINIIPGFILFFWFRKKEQGWLGAIIALLYWTSIAQYELFRWNYIKQALAVNLMLIILILGENKKVLWQSVVFFLLILLHRHTAIFTALIIFFSLFKLYFNDKKLLKKYLLYFLIAGLLALFAYIPYWKTLVFDAVKSLNNNMGGFFLDIKTYIKLQRPIVIMSLFGIVVYSKKHLGDYSFLAYLIGVLWISLSLINFNRTIVFLDIFVIIYAGYGIFFLTKIGKNIFLKTITIIGILSILSLVSINCFKFTAKKNQALINEEEFLSIQNLDWITEKNAIIMNTHKNYSPRIMGRSNRDYVNPGLSDLNPWNYDNWIYWWTQDGSKKCEMLEYTYGDLNRPMYLWLGEQQAKENLSGGECFKHIVSGNTRELYKIIYEQKIIGQQ